VEVRAERGMALSEPFQLLGARACQQARLERFPPPRLLDDEKTNLSARVRTLKGRETLLKGESERFPAGSLVSATRSQLPLSV
jgi:hypothetical protein